VVVVVAAAEVAISRGLLIYIEHQNGCELQNMCFSHREKEDAGRTIQNEIYTHSPCAISEMLMIHGLID
jgi:hypothetical protein